MIAHLFAISEDELCGAGAYTLDISENGSRIHTVLDLIPGELIEFHPLGLGNAVLARVVWTGNEKSKRPHEVGVQFLGSVPQTPGD
jgi:PilZ domain